jgi:DNA-binding phage protein
MKERELLEYLTETGCNPQLSSLATILKNIGLRLAVEVREPKVA